jgi:hypothetical protein
VLEHADAVESVVVSGALAAHDAEPRTSMSAEDRRTAAWAAFAENLTQITTPTLIIVDECSAWWTDTIKVLSATLPRCRLVAFGGQRIEYGEDRLLSKPNTYRTLGDRSRGHGNGDSPGYARGKSLSTATYFQLDDVIDPPTLGAKSRPRRLRPGAPRARPQETAEHRYVVSVRLLPLAELPRGGVAVLRRRRGQKREWSFRAYNPSARRVGPSPERSRRGGGD